MDMKSPYGDVYSKNPDLLSGKAMVAKDSAEYLLAKTEKIPEFSIGGYYGLRQYRSPVGTSIHDVSGGQKAMDMFGVMLGFSLPIWSKKKQNPMIAKANINIQKSKAELDAMTNEIELMIHHAMTEAQKNETLIILYTKQLIPQATENLDAGITGYQQNKIDFMTLTDNFISLYKYRFSHHRAIADYMKAIAELEMLTGKTLVDSR
jgi:outer membrane protein TolC